MSSWFIQRRLITQFSLRNKSYLGDQTRLLRPLTLLILKLILRRIFSVWGHCLAVIKRIFSQVIVLFQAAADFLHNIVIPVYIIQPYQAVTASVEHPQKHWTFFHLSEFLTCPPANTFWKVMWVLLTVAFSLQLQLTAETDEGNKH